MKSRPLLSREVVIEALVDALRPLDFVDAFWEAGAESFGRVDEWSDIDAYVLVDDSAVENTFRTTEKVLNSLSGIRQKYDVGKTQWPGIYQAFYRLDRASDYLLVDLAVMTMSCNERFMETEIHGEPIFYFNKSGVVRPCSVDRKAFDAKLKQRLRRVKARFDMFGIFIQKAINRGDAVEAVDAYRGLVLDSLVEALRMKHYPLHYDFKTRYVHRELPSEVVNRLQDLYFVRDMNDLQTKYLRAVDWFRETVAEVEID